MARKQIEPAIPESLAYQDGRRLYVHAPRGTALGKAVWALRANRADGDRDWLWVGSTRRADLIAAITAAQATETERAEKLEAGHRVTLDRGEHEARQWVKDHGGAWDPAAKQWAMPVDADPAHVDAEIEKIRAHVAKHLVTGATTPDLSRQAHRLGGQQDHTGARSGWLMPTPEAAQQLRDLIAQAKADAEAQARATAAEKQAARAERERLAAAELRDYVESLGRELVGKPRERYTQAALQRGDIIWRTQDLDTVWLVLDCSQPQYINAEQADELLSVNGLLLDPGRYVTIREVLVTATDKERTVNGARLALTRLGKGTGPIDERRTSAVEIPTIRVELDGSTIPPVLSYGRDDEGRWVVQWPADWDDYRIEAGAAHITDPDEIAILDTVETTATVVIDRYRYVVVDVAAERARREAAAAERAAETARYAAEEAEAKAAVVAEGRRLAGELGRTLAEDEPRAHRVWTDDHVPVGTVIHKRESILWAEGTERVDGWWLVVGHDPDDDRDAHAVMVTPTADELAAEKAAANQAAAEAEAAQAEAAELQALQDAMRVEVPARELTMILDSTPKARDGGGSVIYRIPGTLETGNATPKGRAYQVPRTHVEVTATSTTYRKGSRDHAEATWIVTVTGNPNDIAHVEAGRTSGSLIGARLVKQIEQ